MSDDLEHGKIVRKIWGEELWVINTPYFCFKKLTIRPGYQCSMHRHLVKNEAFYVVRGEGWAMIDNKAVHLTPGVLVKVNSGVWHTFWNSYGKGELVMWEVSSHHSDDDVERCSESSSLRYPPVISWNDLT